ncbi:MAG: circadian clock protein KaiC [Thermoplasmata archaeon]|nr:MAG: circadian clock protein KaiC [Thermoplasmata archaeon]RLF62354.1 MAG: circadian clock protein KaiC [Thermoplasmata archaeon]HDM25598.1 circadian clock protein KaiC [Thermoplasmatales archaeon]
MEQIQTLPKCRTGIPELDNILRGGIPIGNTVLVVGSSGCGKTTLCMQFLINGAKAGEKGVFFTITEPLFKLTKNLENYEFYDPYLVDSGILHLVDLRIICERMGLQADRYTFEDASALLDVLKDIANELKVKRLVIDSITALCYRLQTKEMIRDFIFKLGSFLATIDCTTLLTSEVPPRTLQYSLYGIEEFISDGIIFLGDMERGGDLVRTLQVVKMRGTEHTRAKYAMQITPKGISLSPLLKTK